MNELIKRPAFIFIAVIAILVGLVYSLSLFANEDLCVPVTEDMTIKEANRIAEVCEKEITDLGLQHDELSSQQQELSKQADERRKLLGKNPVVKPEVIQPKVEIVETNKAEVLAGSMYIHQHINPLPTVGGNTPKERFENLVNHYGKVNPTDFVEVGREYGIAEELLACIAYAETHVGTHLKAKNNIMNYGNNDSGAKVPYDTIKNNIRAAAHGLKYGTYLSHNKKLGELSNGGRIALGLPTCDNKGVYCYATSAVNWRGNTYDCLSRIHGENKDWDNYLF